MGRSMSQRKAKAYEDIERLKANRRKDLIKCAAALAAIVVLVTVKLGLETVSWKWATWPWEPP